MGRESKEMWTYRNWPDPGDGRWTKTGASRDQQAGEWRIRLAQDTEDTTDKEKN